MSEKIALQEEDEPENNKDQQIKPAKSNAKGATKKKSSRKKSRSKGSLAEAKLARRTSLFPASSFEEALTIPNAIQKHAAGQKVRRLTLFDQMKKSPDSGPSRQLITNANKYGLIKGNYAADYHELTPEGSVASSVETLAKE